MLIKISPLASRAMLGRGTRLYLLSASLSVEDKILKPGTIVNLQADSPIECLEDLAELLRGAQSEVNTGIDNLLEKYIGE